MSEKKPKPEDILAQSLTVLELAGKLLEANNQILQREFNQVQSMTLKIDGLEAALGRIEKALAERPTQPQQPAKQDFREKVPTCKYCGQEIKWSKPYVQGQGPLNLDGSPHNCRGGSR